MKKIAIVTGISRGIGFYIAKKLLEMDVRVVGISRSACSLAHCNVLALQMDVTNLDEEYIKEQIKAKWHQGLQEMTLISLIHNAATLHPIATVSTSEKQSWMDTFDVNVFSAVHLLKSFIKFMKPKASFVIVSSGASMEAYPAWGAYCCSKAAANMLVKCVSVEEPHLISVAIRPGKYIGIESYRIGVVDTQMQTTIRDEGLDGGMTYHVHRKLVDMHKQGTLIHPEIPANAIVRVAVSENVSLNGKYISYDGPEVEMCH